MCVYIERYIGHLNRINVSAPTRDQISISQYIGLILYYRSLENNYRTVETES